jgi:putative tryptophan/tyrosine transport system substrate-binding protein
MNRREFITGLGGATLVRPANATAQTPAKVYRVGVLIAAAPVTDASPFGAAFVRSMARFGYTRDRNLAIESRGANGHVENLKSLVDDLAATKVDVILTIGYPAALAAKTGTLLPVVAVGGGDPVATGLVDSLARPGGHVTGLSDLSAELSPKRLQLLIELMPGLRRVAMLWNAGDPSMTLRYRTTEAAARAMGITVEPHGVHEPKDFDPAFAAMAGTRPDAIIVVNDGLTIGQRSNVFEFAGSNRLPALYEEHEVAVRDGGLMFYGPDGEERFERAAYLIDRILKGAKPADLPFEQPTRFRFVINGRTAKALGLIIPPALLLRADEVIE